MSSRNSANVVVHPAKRGLNTTAPPTLLEADELVIADNVEYDTSGVRRKRPGTTRYNLTSLGSTIVFTGLGDFHRDDTCIQQFVAHAGTGFYKDDGDGVWDAIAGPAWGSEGSLTVVTIAGGYAIFSNGTDPPRTWDQTGLGSLTGAPTFSFSSYHLRRLWAGPVPGSESRVWYTAAGNVLNWTGVDAGTINFDEGDGDQLVGMSQPFQNRLYFFKGPNHGSVFNISGNTPNTFVRSRLFSAAACVGHRTIVTTPHDIYWLSRYGAHSLQATQKFGDTEEFFLSHKIQSEYRALSTDGLEHAVSFYHPTRNIVGWYVAGSGTRNDRCLVYNYVLGEWSIWRHTSFQVAACMVAVDPTAKRPRLYLGGYDGYVRAGDQVPLKTDDLGSSYTYRVRTGVLMRQGSGNELYEKQLYGVTTFFQPTAATSSATMSVWLDSPATPSATKSLSFQGGGSFWDQSTWDNSFWDGRGGLGYDEFIVEGRYRTIQVQWEQTASGSADIELTGHAVRATIAETQLGE